MEKFFLFIKFFILCILLFIISFNIGLYFSISNNSIKIINDNMEGLQYVDLEYQNGREYLYGKSQKGTGKWENDNCVIASMYMIFKYYDEDYDKTVESIREEMGHRGGTNIIDIKNYIEDYTEYNIEGYKGYNKYDFIEILKQDKNIMFLGNVYYMNYYLDIEDKYAYNNHHALIIYGYRIDDNNNFYWLIKDPGVEHIYEEIPEDYIKKSIEDRIPHLIIYP